MTQQQQHIQELKFTVLYSFSTSHLRFIHTKNPHHYRLKIIFFIVVERIREEIS
jgi:hypothetical protein